MRKIVDLLTFAVIFALLPFEARATQVDLSNVGIVCMTHRQALTLADRYEMNGGTTFESLRENYFGEGWCIMYRKTSVRLIRRLEIFHGSRGTYQVVEVADSKGKRFWGFATLYPEPSNAA